MVSSILAEVIMLFVVLIPVAIPFIFWERNIRKFRRQHGLSIYKDVRKEMEQIEFNEMYEKEQKAKEAYEKSKN